MINSPKGRNNRKAMKYQATITKLWGVSWGIDEVRSTDTVWFEEEADANQVSMLRLGWYGSTGSVHSREYIDGRDAPAKTYTTALEWAKANLSYDDMVKHGFKP